jgi:hypothetical protein
MALLSVREEGGSANGVLITDKYHGPGGDSLSMRLKIGKRQRKDQLPAKRPARHCFLKILELKKAVTSSTGPISSRTSTARS